MVVAVTRSFNCLTVRALKLSEPVVFVLKCMNARVYFFGACIITIINIIAIFIFSLVIIDLCYILTCVSLLNLSLYVHVEPVGEMFG